MFPTFGLASLGDSGSMSPRQGKRSIQPKAMPATPSSLRARPDCCRISRAAPPSSAGNSKSTFSPYPRKEPERRRTRRAGFGFPGVGKTRLAAEIGIEAGTRDALIFLGTCYDREKQSVPFIPFVEMLEAALARAQSPESFRDSLGKDASEIAWLLPELRRLFPDIALPLDFRPSNRAALFLMPWQSFLIDLRAGNPCCFSLTTCIGLMKVTLSLLNHLANRSGQLPVMIVAAYRDSELPTLRVLWPEPSTSLIHFQVAHRIHLAGLGKYAV